MRGITANQMVSAPKRAVYIWCTNNLVYPKALARKLGRSDLEIHSPSFLRERFRGRRFSGLIIDHSTELSNSEFLNYIVVMSRIV